MLVVGRLVKGIGIIKFVSIRNRGIVVSSLIIGVRFWRMIVVVLVCRWSIELVYLYISQGGITKNSILRVLYTTAA